MTATYTVPFDGNRIGRSHEVEPMTFEDVHNPDELAALIYERSRRFLLSRGIDVLVDLDDMEVRIYVGIARLVGTGTITEHAAVTS